MRSNFRKRWNNLTLKLEAIYRIHSYRKAAKARLKHINSGYDCKQEYKATVIPFWAKYNIKPNKMWWLCLASMKAAGAEAKSLPARKLKTRHCGS